MKWAERAEYIYSVVVFVYVCLCKRSKYSYKSVVLFQVGIQLGHLVMLYIVTSEVGMHVKLQECVVSDDLD